MLSLRPSFPIKLQSLPVLALEEEEGLPPSPGLSRANPDSLRPLSGSSTSRGTCPRWPGGTTPPPRTPGASLAAFSCTPGPSGSLGLPPTLHSAPPPGSPQQCSSTPSSLFCGGADSSPGAVVREQWWVVAGRKATKCVSWCSPACLLTASSSQEAAPQESRGRH